MRRPAASATPPSPPRRNSRPPLPASAWTRAGTKSAPATRPGIRTPSNLASHTTGAPSARLRLVRRNKRPTSGSRWARTMKSRLIVETWNSFPPPIAPTTIDTAVVMSTASMGTPAMSTLPAGLAAIRSERSHRLGSNPRASDRYAPNFQKRKSGALRRADHASAGASAARSPRTTKVGMATSATAHGVRAQSGTTRAAAARLTATKPVLVAMASRPKGGVARSSKGEPRPRNSVPW